MGFAIVAVGLGLTLALSELPSIIQRVGFALYGAGAPISATFAAIAGELPLAPYTDIIVWLVAAVLVTKHVERRSIGLAGPLTKVIAGALVFGAAIGMLIERA